jgi:hypothetical protein
LTLQSGFLDEDATERLAKKSAEVAGSAAGRGGERAEIISALQARVQEKQGGYVSGGKKRGVSFV